MFRSSVSWCSNFKIESSCASVFKTSYIRSSKSDQEYYWLERFQFYPNPGPTDMRQMFYKCKTLVDPILIFIFFWKEKEAFYFTYRCMGGVGVSWGTVRNGVGISIGFVVPPSNLLSGLGYMLLTAALHVVYQQQCSPSCCWRSLGH